MSLLSLLIAGSNPVAFSTSGSTNSTRTGASEFTTLTVGNDGTMSATKSAAGTWVGGGGVALSGSWILPTGGTPGNNYWVKVTVTSGAFTSGDTVGSWLALTSARNFTCTAAVSGSVSATCNVQIAADAAGVNILATLSGVIVNATFV